MSRRIPRRPAGSARSAGTTKESRRSASRSWSTASSAASSPRASPRPGLAPAAAPSMSCSQTSTRASTWRPTRAGRSTTSGSTSSSERRSPGRSGTAGWDACCATPRTRASLRSSGARSTPWPDPTPGACTGSRTAARASRGSTPTSPTGHRRPASATSRSASMREPALEVAERVLDAVSGDDAAVVVHSERSGLARFAGKEVHQPTLIDNTSVELTVVRDGRMGIALGNRLEADGLADLARRAVEAVESASPDPELPSLAPRASYPEIAGFDEETAALTPGEQARLAAAAIEAAQGFPVYGYFTSGACELAVASTTGLRAQQRSTDATVLVLAAGEEASGYHERTSWEVGRLDPDAVARESVALAGRTRGASEIEPGVYAAVLEPFAVAELLEYFAWDTFNGLGLLEERSYLAGRLGERVFDEKISIADDPLDSRGLPKAFDFEGVPKQRVELVEQGIARGAVWDRATAARAGAETKSTGHAPPNAERKWGPAPTAQSMAAGEIDSPELLAELVGDGIWVTRVHYLGIVDPREGVLTGMTRDGTFRIRDGKIAEPLVNLRFTVSMPELLSEVAGLTRQRLLVNRNQFYDDRYPFGALVPTLATARFNITGTGSSPGI